MRVCSPTVLSPAKFSAGTIDFRALVYDTAVFICLSFYNTSTRDVALWIASFCRLALDRMKLEGYRSYYPTSPLVIKVADLEISSVKNVHV